MKSRIKFLNEEKEFSGSIIYLTVKGISFPWSQHIKNSSKKEIKHESDDYMLTGTLHYTMNHILLLRLMMVSPFEKIKTLHNLLYLAASRSSDCPRPFIFIKLKSGVYSFEIQKVLSEFKSADFMEENLKLNDRGREIYYSFAHVLKYHKFPQNCLKLAEKYGDNLWQVDHEILFDQNYREKKVGDKIIFQPIL